MKEKSSNLRSYQRWKWITLCILSMLGLFVIVAQRSFTADQQKSIPEPQFGQLFQKNEKEHACNPAELFYRIAQELPDGVRIVSFFYKNGEPATIICAAQDQEDLLVAIKRLKAQVTSLNGREEDEIFCTLSLLPDQLRDLLK